MDDIDMKMMKATSMNVSLHCLLVGLCLLQLLLQGYIETNCLAKHFGVIFSAGFCLVLGGFIFGMSTTQSIWNEVHGAE